MAGVVGASAFLLLTLILSASLAAPPPQPQATKRSDENIQFGNQQNKPVSVLDEDDVLPGAFPSSETTESGDGGDREKPTADPGDRSGEEANTKQEAAAQPTTVEHEVSEDAPPALPRPHTAAPAPIEGHPHLPPVQQPQRLSHHHTTPIHREEMISDLPPVALASRWKPPSQFYNPHKKEWGMPVSSLYGAADYRVLPIRRRRRAVERHRRQPTPDPRKVLQVSLHALRTGHRHKRDVSNIQRIRRDLSNIDLDKLRREVDVVELLAMLAKPPRHRNPGFATVTYAPMAPAPPRFAPQPKLFPDYEEDEDEEEEEDEEDDGDMDYPRQGIRPPTVPARGMLPSDDRIWRRSGGYSLSAVPGFKRSVFRANTPAPPVRTLNPGDMYSLAAMLGAELDPVTHRLRRAAM